MQAAATATLPPRAFADARGGNQWLRWRPPLTLVPTMRPMAAARSELEPSSARAERDARLAVLLAAAAHGDAAAFESFYDATVGYAQAVARRMLRGADVEDLLADAYFEAWRHAPRFEPERGSAVTWLLTIVRSRALDALRRRAAEPLADVAEAPDAPAGAEADPAEALWRCQAGTRLHAALATLSANERWVIGLAYFRDMSASEIAAATGMPLGSVKTAILRGRNRLRQALAE
jgi:RNA polymerase sigma-70 factor, ECF subfamily